MTTTDGAAQTQTLLTGQTQEARTAEFWRVALLVAGSVMLYRTTGIFTGEKTSFLIKEVLKLSASGMATLGIFTAIPSYLRPFMGATSDLLPLLGYHRRTYYAISWLLMAAGYIALAFLPHYTSTSVVLLIILAGFGQNLLYVIMDAVMVAVGNRTGTVQWLQSLQQFLPLFMGLTFAGIVSGYVTQHWSYKACYAVAAATATVSLLLVFLIDEVRHHRTRQSGESEEDHAARLVAKREERARITAAMASAARSPGLWAMVAFVFYLIITPGTNTAMFYYQVDALHFSKQFIGELAIPGSAGAILAILVFAAVSKKLPVVSMVVGAYLMDCSLYLISMGMRGHISGIVVTFLLSFLGMIYNLCLLTIAARACPPGIEGTVYGLVIAAIGLAGALGEKMGAAFYTYYGPPHGTTAHGWFMLLWFGFAFTVIAAVFIPFLPAWARSMEPLYPKKAA